MAERFGRIEEARGSIPLTSTPQRAKRPFGLPAGLPARLSAALWCCACAVVLTAACASSAASGQGRDEGRYAGIAVAGSELRQVPDMTFADTSGQEFHLAQDTQGKVRLVYQMFTNCPDICGVQLAQLASVLNRPGAPANVEVLAVTVDPQRDTPEVLRAYLDQFSDDFVGLIPHSEDQLTDLQNALGALASIRVYETTTTSSHATEPDGQEHGGRNHGEPEHDQHDDQHGDAEYDIAHDARVFAFAPNGYGYVQYPHPTRQTQFDHDLPILAMIEASDPADAGL